MPPVANNPNDLQQEVEYGFLSRLIKPDDKPVSSTFKDKMMWAALGAIGALATGSTIPRLLKSPLTKSQLIGGVVSGGVAGFSAPILHNIILKEKQGQLPKGHGKKEYKALAQLEETAKREIQEFPQLFKQSAFLGRAAGKVIGATSTGVSGTLRGGLKAVREGLRWKVKPTYRGAGVWKVPLGGKIWGYTVKGGVGVGAIAGGSKLYQRSRVKSGANYTTMLRNNILAGNIKPNELSIADMAAVQRIGMA